MLKKIIITSMIFATMFYVIQYLLVSKDNLSIQEKTTPDIGELEANQTFNSSPSVKMTNTYLTEESSEKEYIVDCSTEQNINDKKFNDYQQSADSHFDSLPKSNSKKHLLEYTLFGSLPDGKTRHDLLINYNKTFPRDTFILQQIINSCDESLCTPNFIHEIIEQDKNNGAIWLELLHYNLSINDDERILNSINELVKSSFYDGLQMKKVKIYIKSLEHTKNNNLYYNMIIAFGNEAMNLPAYAPLVQWCRDNINSILIADACVQLGTYLEVDSKSLIDQAIGLALQEIVFDSQGNSELFNRAKIKRENLTSYAKSEQFLKASSLAIFDEQLMWDWLNNNDYYGEAKAARLLIEEAVARSKNEHYLPCDMDKMTVL